MTTSEGQRWRVALAALAVAGAGSAHAASHDPFAYTMRITPEHGSVDPVIDHRYTAAFAARQQHAQTTPDNAQCFVAEFTRQDAVLNRDWKASLARLPASEQPALITAQRRWVVARDPFCKARSDDYSGGTIAPIIYVDCRVELTIRRSLWLEHLR
ncbi:MAG: DUF1311 domain-containing protein [Caulobacteraceae bacterium]|nr:DUF1311 domain-containing protein [Caulobacteraceae bacterium]